MCKQGSLVKIIVALWLGLSWGGSLLRAQKTDIPVGRLDPTRSLSSSAPIEVHSALAEEYIWTAGDAAALHADHHRYSFARSDVKVAPHFFRSVFQLDRVPSSATLYIAGPRSVKIYLNGQLIDRVESNIDSPLGMHVYATNLSGHLQQGSNTLALEVIRGRGIVSLSNSRIVEQQTLGEVLVAKIVPAASWVDAPAILISSPQWKSNLTATSGWEQPSFDDRGWANVQSLGSMEGSIDLFQWNADAGLYDWPGYSGISPFLRQYEGKVEKVSHVVEGRSHFLNLDALTGASVSEFAVKPSAPLLAEEEAPSLLLDFGREVSGRLELDSDCDCEASVRIAYGESDIEALKSGHYLGSQLLHIGPHSVGYGPKSGFRYVRLSFLGGAPEIRFKAIRLKGIYYPVEYKGSFDSSDPLLNRIWETGAYTMHLCMQDDIWDAVKRDRGRWIGDLDVGGHVVNEIFGDNFLMEDTMSHLLGESPVSDHVNDIPGYSALWITSLADYYRHTGAREYLLKTHDRMLELLKVMDADFDEKNLFVNKQKVWLFVDWSPELVADTPETRKATQIEYYRAYREAAYLLREVGDVSHANWCTERAESIRKATNAHFLEPASGTYGPRWQTNAMAVLSGLATSQQYPSLWKNILSTVNQDQYTAPIISPYYNYYVVTAMAEMGHRPEALKWIRKYWGGMLEEGATSFWEAYDLRWPKDNPHLNLQADGTTGFFVSLAHGWSSGATAWVMEQVLGIQPTEAGFRKVTIRPDLLDLDWVKGGEPTPQGILSVSMKKGGPILLDLPQGIEGKVLVPISSANAKVLVNGVAMPVTIVEDNRRAEIVLNQARHYEIRGE